MNILLATDLSLEAEGAARWALALRDRIHQADHQATLRALYVSEPSWHAMKGEAQVTDMPGLNYQTTHEVRDWLKGVDDDTADVDIVVREGNPSREITEYCKQNPVDWLITGTSGAGAFGRALLGSTSLKLAHRAPTRTVLVKPDHQSLPDHPRMAVAVDFFPGSQSALFSAAQLAHLNEGTLELVHVLQDHPTPTLNTGLVNYLAPRDMEELSARTRDSLNALCAQVQALYAGLKVEAHVFSGRAAPTLIHFCEHNAIDLVVLAKRSRSALQDRALGSVAGAVARKHPTTVMLVPIDEESED
ncbi:hypothetical protein DL240_07360 [Lujinxingia litoralis]|uniref:UspA domain-containing protein n=1 Tax=Lujinxingia litoralis TaxID=2211119 RepID=A0A328CAI9_9DELT|nr:universal stress protein [Lujinxingia litoralis]RAL23958.1 hypothetical protein DL240_07360 [Lujinxingia litoralis]